MEERARRLRLVPGEYDQVLRLDRLRRDHPAIVVGAGNGWWQAVIPASDGEIVTTRYTLRALLDVTSRTYAVSQRLIRSRLP